MSEPAGDGKDQRRAGFRVRLKRRLIPFVQQTTNADCGAACLTMTLRYFGKDIRLETVRSIVTAQRDATDASQLLQAARWFGLRGRGVTIEIDHLRYLEPGAILHWEFRHFVVFEKLKRDSVVIVDPGIGRRRVSLEEFGRSFTGVALMLEPSASFETGSGDRPTTWRYVRKILGQRQVLFRITLTSLLLQCFALALPLLTGVVVDRVIPRGDLSLLRVLGLGCLILVVFQFLTSLIRSYLFLYLRAFLDARLTRDFLDHLADLPYAFFQSRSTGDLIMRLNSNSAVREMLTSGALSAIMDGSLVSLYLILLFATSPALGSLVVSLGLARVGLFLLTRRRQRELMAQELQCQARSQGYQVQLLAGIEVLKASGAEHRAVEHWTNLFFDVLNVNLVRGRLNALVESTMTALGVFSGLAILLFGAFLVLEGRLTLGTMLAMSALAAGFLGPLSALLATAQNLQLVGSYIERIDDVLSHPVEQDPSRVRPAGKLEGRITLRSVSFRYGPHTKMALEDVSFDVRPGQFVAIVGRSGSGKSTLASVIVGLYPPTSGTVQYDGVDLTELDIRSVRRQIGIVPQRTYLFGSTIRANIALADPTLRWDEIFRAARIAEIHDDIERMPLKYETILGDAGTSLAGGQTQRIALARALAQRPSILLLDEATSDLDAVTEQRIQANLAALRCTRIVIAHRLSTIRDADTILVLDDGRIVEQGRHDDLVALGGIYAQLVSAQDSRPASKADLETTA